MPDPTPTALAILGGFTSTQSRWSVELDGVRFYKDERVRVHAAITDPFFDATAVADPPVALVVAGGPACGKTTLLATLEVPPAAVHLDADSIKLQLPEYAELREAGQEQAAELVHEESADIARDVFRRTLAEQRNLILDAVGDSEPGKFVSKLEQAHDAGYVVEVVYADVDAETAIQRAAGRSKRTGRVVPEDELRRLHREVSARFPEVERLEWLTSLRVFAMDEAGPRLIVERTHAGALSIYDDGRLRVFREKATK